jgi:hypothetical protein
MNSKRGEHSQHHQDAVFLYVLQALDSAERAKVEAQISRVLITSTEDEILW